LSSSNGTPLPSTTEITHIPGSSIVEPEHLVVLRDVRQSSSSVTITWLTKDSGSLQTVSLSPEGKITKNSVEPRSLEGNFDSATGYTGLKDVGLASRGYFLALLPNDGADLVKWNQETKKVRAAFHFEGGDLAARSNSIWGGFEGADAKESWVTRLFWSHGLQVCPLCLDSRRADRLP
jgi:hypothetical protein